VVIVLTHELVKLEGDWLLANACDFKGLEDVRFYWDFFINMLGSHDNEH
jgi:hypothetical protein